MESVPHWTLAVHWCEARLAQVQPVLTNNQAPRVGGAGRSCYHPGTRSRFPVPTDGEMCRDPILEFPTALLVSPALARGAWFPVSSQLTQIPSFGPLPSCHLYGHTGHGHVVPISNTKRLWPRDARSLSWDHMVSLQVNFNSKLETQRRKVWSLFPSESTIQGKWLRVRRPLI